MTIVLTKAIGSAMATQVGRVNDSPERLKEYIRELEAHVARQRETIEKLQSIVHGHTPSAFILQDECQTGRVVEVHAASGTMMNGRPVGNQSEFARRHNVQAYQVCRWCTRGELQFVRRDGKYYVYLDQPCPAAKARGRKKAA